MTSRSDTAGHSRHMADTSSGIKISIHRTHAHTQQQKAPPKKSRVPRQMRATQILRSNRAKPWAQKEGIHPSTAKRTHTPHIPSSRQTTTRVTCPDSDRQTRTETKPMMFRGCPDLNLPRQHPNAPDLKQKPLETAQARTHGAETWVLSRDRWGRHDGRQANKQTDGAARAARANTRDT